MHTYEHINMYMQIHTHTYRHSTSMHAYEHAHMYIQIHTHTCKHLPSCARTNIHICINKYLHTY